MGVPERDWLAGSWGDPFMGKKETHVRVYVQNIGGLPTETEADEKYTHLWHFITKHKIDIIALPESSTNWDKVPYENRLQERTKGWWESTQWSTAHNRLEQHSSKFQPGGVVLGLVNMVVHRAGRPGDDKVGLGRWCWARLRGKTNTTIRIVAVYRPCFSTGPLSTYQQQLRHPDFQRPQCPRARFMVELLEEIKEWTAAGELLLVAGDFNDDTTQPGFKRRMQEMGLVDALASLHGQPTLPTYNRGTFPIDAMYASPALLHGAKGGYLDFEDGLLSDHRGLWLDLSKETLWGSRDHYSIGSNARRLKCADPRVVGKYNQHLLAEIRQLGLIGKINQLQQGPSISQQDIDSVDKELTSTRLEAERHCQKIKAGGVAWCPLITQAIQAIQYWKGRLKRVKGGTISNNVLQKRARHARIKYDVYGDEPTRDLITKRLAMAYQVYKRLKMQTDRRDTWLGAMIAAQAEDRGCTRAQIWKQVRDTEKMRNISRMVKYTLGTQETRKGLTQVAEAGVEGRTGTTYSDKKSVEKACLAEAGRRFTQANQTPFLTGPLLRDFGELGVDRTAFKAVLAGTYTPPPGCAPLTVKLLHALRRPADLPDIQLGGEEEFSQGWRKAREQTASLPSKLHFGHYMAGTFNPTIAILTAKMAELLLSQGISLKRWKKGLNVLLEKIPGNCNLDKLRIIVLFEADFNYNNKRIGRAAMWSAEAAGLLAPEQYGSRKHKSANLQCLNKRLLYDLVRFHRQSLALCSNDTKSCYDRIVLTVAALCLCRVGAPLASVASMVRTLHGMRHYTRTAFGDSNTSQGQREWGEPIAGIGQGNGAGPQIWAAVSSPLFEILRSEGFFALLIGAISGQSRKLAGFAFVDDTDLIVTDEGDSELEVAKKMQESVATWEALLSATGGALVPEKCFWYQVRFEFQGSKWTYATKKGTIPLQVRNAEGKLVTIPQLEVTEARRTLGVRVAPDGNNKAELEHLMQTASTWFTAMKAGRISHEAAVFSLKQVVLKRLTYPLVTTTFTEAECNTIMKPILAAGLPAMGVVRTLARAAVHGPVRYQGLEIPNLYTEQIVARITTLLQYGPQVDDITGSLIRFTAEAFRLELGITGQLFNAPVDLAPGITDSWIKATWLDMATHNIHITADLPDFQVPREGDTEIMRVFLCSGFRKDEIASLNRCRMYSRVIFTSDICTGAGDQVDSRALQGQICSKNYEWYKWPRTGTPTPGEWALWNRAIRVAYNLDNRQRLPQKLGDWHFPTNTRNRWYLDTEDQRLWYHVEEGWQMHSKIPHRSRTARFHAHFGLSSEGPNLSNCLGVTVVNGHQHIGVQSGSRIRAQPLGIALHAGLQATEEHQFRKRWEFEEEVMGKVPEIVRAIHDGKAIAVSDGSYKEGCGAAAWTIEGADATDKIIGAGLVPGTTDDHSAFRSELMGLLGIMLLLKDLQEQYGATSGRIQVFCDGKSALGRAASSSPVSITEPHSDLITAIHNLRHRIKWNVTFTHVRGHQDGGHPTVLSREAMLNVEMDSRAKAKLGPGTGSMAIPYEGWACYIEAKKIIKQWMLTLREHINGAKILQYWKQKERFGDGTAEQVDWDAIRRAMTDTTWRRRKWVTKFATGDFAHGKNMRRWRFRTVSNCPRCNQDGEDKQHILRCPAPTAQQRWNIALQELEGWLRSAKTDPKLAEAIIAGLRGWYSGDQLIPMPNLPAVIQQNQLGWALLLEGGLSRMWQTEQAKFWTTIKTRKSSKRWVSELIKKLWEISWDLWTHRNEELHSSDTARGQILEHDVNTRIAQAYQSGSRELPRDALHLIQAPQERVLEQPLITKQLWLDTWEAAKRRQERAARDPLAGE